MVLCVTSLGLMSVTNICLLSPAHVPYGYVCVQGSAAGSGRQFLKGESYREAVPLLHAPRPLLFPFLGPFRKERHPER